MNTLTNLNEVILAAYEIEKHAFDFGCWCCFCVSKRNRIVAKYWTVTPDCQKEIRNGVKALEQLEDMYA